MGAHKNRNFFVSTVFRYTADTVIRLLGIYRQVSHCMQEEKRKMKKNSKRVSVVILNIRRVTPVFVLIAVLFITTGVLALGVQERVSIDSSGTQANANSFEPAISARGRYVAFHSYATNLVAGDTNGVRDVFVYDRSTGATTRVSVDLNGIQGNDHSRSPSISADGRYVAFYSDATNLVTGDTNSRSDVFVHDLSTGATTRVSIASDGTQANSGSSLPEISADGRYVAFDSTAWNLVAGDNNGVSDVFVHDRSNGTTSRVSVDSNGSQANGYSSAPSISADGRYVSFVSLATNLVMGDTNDEYDVFVHDRSTGATTRVSVDSSGAQADNDSTSSPSISVDGRFVAFQSYAANLVPGDTNANADIFVHDRSTGATIRVSVDSSGAQADSASYVPSISADGRYVAFQSFATNLVTGDTNGGTDIFVHDRNTGATRRVSVDAIGTQANEYSYHSAISADGLYVAFRSDATNLVTGDTNGQTDIFVADTDFSSPTCYALTIGHTGSGSDPTASLSNSIGCSAGQYVAGENITLSRAVPDSGWEISGWSGTDDDFSTANSNTLTMPANTHSTSVAYSEYTPPPPVGSGTYENENVNVSYTGSWTTTASSNSSGGSTSYSNDPAASASLSFYGGQVSLLYTGYSNRGEIEISIDGGEPEILDQYNSEYTYQNRWDSPLLDTSLHTITLNHSGDLKYIELDALIVAPHNPTGSLIKAIEQLTIDGDVFNDDFPYVGGDYAVWASNNQDNTKIYLHQISTGTTTQIGNEGLLPKISGNHVIWSGCGGICLYQIDTATTTSIEDASMEYPQEPYIDGDNIVWSSALDGDVEIYLYQVSTGIKTQLTSNTTEEYYPYIKGNSIVWAGMTGGDVEITLYQINTGTTTQISNNEFELNWWPQPSGDYVVWFGDDYDGDLEIMLYQISTGTTTQITDNAIDDDYPEIDGNYIVWGQTDGSYFTRHLYVINTGQTKQISPDLTYASRTRNIIKGDFVTWSNFADYPAEEDECYLYQISTDTLNLVAENSLGSPYPHLSETHLVWNANYDIFLAELDIPEDTPPAAVTLNAATGTYPGEVDLSWMAPGADDNVGTATEYILRYANVEIDTQAKWDAASDVTGEPVPQIAGTEESMTVSSLSPGQTYYFALRTLDESGNLSDLSNSPSVEMQLPTPVGPGTYENDDVHIISTGTWTTWDIANASGGSTRYSDDPEASATLLFYGGQVSLIFTGDTDRGDIEILIDDKLMPGVEPAVVNQYSSSTTFQNRWDSPLLDNGLHNITVQHPGGAENIDLDAFIVAEHNPTASIVESINQLTFNDSFATLQYDIYPNIDGDYVVWTSNGELTPGIFLYRISTGITIQLDDVLNYHGSPPQIDGNYIVWIGNDGIMLHQIDNGVTSKIVDDGFNGPVTAHIEGDHIVWESDIGIDRDKEIYVYQISTGIKSQLTNNTSSDSWPDVDGDYVVWEGNEAGGGDIYLHQFSTAATINITNNQNGNFGAHISGDYVVWVSSNPANVYLYDIRTATTTQITNDSIDNWIPYIDGNYVVWLKSTAAPGIKDIYLYAIDTSFSKKITSTGTLYFWDYQTGPYVKDDFVFWMSRDGSPENDNEVYLYQISTDTIHNISDNLDTGDGHPELDGNHLVWSGDFEIYLATLNAAINTPPSAVTLTAVTGSETGEVDLNWIAPGDDGDTGTAAEYILRYADSAIDSESAWDSASEVTGEPVPQIAGSAETLTVSGLIPGQTYYFALRTMDSDANLSELSNSPSAVAKAPSHPGVGTYENEDANIVYTGTWTTWNDVRASGGSIRYSNDPAATATLTFYGRQVSLLFTRYTTRGNISITIDGGTPVLLNQYGSTLTFQNRWDSPLMDAGTHTVVLRHPGGTKYIDLDALIVSSPETIPPAAVTLNASTGTSNGQVNLSWTAPGDDDMTGTATSYIVRYASAAIDTQAKWDAATDVTGEPTPLVAGSAQSMTVSGLTPGQTYYFALRTSDEVPNMSALSNSPSAAAQSPAPVPPGTYQNEDPNIAYTGTWTTWNDSRASGASTRYSNDTTASATLTFTGRQVSLLFTRYTSRGNVAITIDGGTPVLLNQYGAALSFQNRWDSPLMAAGTHTVKFSHPGGTKYIDVDAIIISDPETIPPAAVTLYAATGASNGQVYLEWAAPGDDDVTGTAASYIVRYAAAVIDSQAKWDAAADVTGEPTPLVAGTPQSMTVSGLTPGQTYFFALRSLDDSNNLSALSNSPSAAAKAPTPVSPGTYQK